MELDTYTNIHFYFTNDKYSQQIFNAFLRKVYYNQLCITILIRKNYKLKYVNKLLK